LLRENDFKNFLVEIGGEVSTSGLRKDGKKWKIGINRPRKNSLPNIVYKVIELCNKSMATSGDYRFFFEKKGRIYSHIINPKTGCPVKNNVVSVSIIAKSCMVADGLATGIMILGHKKGIELIDKLEDVECQIITVDKDNKTLRNYYSKGFDTN